MSPYQLEFAIHYATRADDFLDHHPDSKVYRETVDLFIELDLIQLSPVNGVAWAGTEKLCSYVKRLGEVPIEEPADKSETEVIHVLREHGKKIDQLLQVLKNATKCGRCRGKGSVETALGPDECPECQGTGVKS